jgi:hypothetical protein
MSTFPLQKINGHLFIEVDGYLWLLDTGAPLSFGSTPDFYFEGEQFELESTYLGLTPESLSGFIGVKTNGLLGADVLNSFDVIFNGLENTIVFSLSPLDHEGQVVNLDEFMGIPILSATINGIDYRMFFDTGAQISYFQDDALNNFPPAGQMTDYYPGFGQFQTDTHNVEFQIGGSSFILRCGSLPDLLGMTLMMADTEGIIGSQIIQNRVIGYFPRGKELVFNLEN